MEDVPMQTGPLSPPASNFPITAPAVSDQPLTPAAPPVLCPQCHQPVPAEFYFCPNCGAKMRQPPLSTSLLTQAWIYGFSIILPIICYLAIGYWPAVKYFRSNDPRAKQIGMIAIALLAVSSIITFWWGFIWLQQTVQSSVNSVGNLGGF